MKKAFIFLVFGIVLLLASGVIAAGITQGSSAKINDVVKKVIKEKG